MKLEFDCKECEMLHGAITWCEDEGRGVRSEMWLCLLWDAMRHWYCSHLGPLDKAEGRC